MDALRSTVRHLVAAARRGGHTDGSVKISDPLNVAAAINTRRGGSASTVSSRQTVRSDGKTTHLTTTRSSRTTAEHDIQDTGEETDERPTDHHQ